MSWGEVKKINSDLTIPLNVLLWVNELKTYGTLSYVYKDLNMMLEISKHDFVINDIVCRRLIVNSMNDNKGLGLFCKQFLDSKNEAFDNSPTMNELFQNDSLITEIFSNETLKTLFHTSTTFQDMVCKDRDLITTVLFNNEVFAEWVVSKDIMKAYPYKISYQTWVRVLDNTVFLSRILTSEDSTLIEECLKTDSYGGTLIDGLIRSPKGFNEFIKSNPSNVARQLMHDKITTEDAVLLESTLLNTSYFSRVSTKVEMFISEGSVDIYNLAYPSGKDISAVTDINPDLSISIVTLFRKNSSTYSPSLYRLSSSDLWFSANGTTETSKPSKPLAIGGFKSASPKNTAYIGYKMYAPV